jgi:lipopolysaccharide transport system permease protein
MLMSLLLWVANPLTVFRHFRQHRYLLMQLAWREVQVRYRGSWLGPLWSLLTPLLMLAVYTFVFSVIFKARWGDGIESQTDTALALFGGLTAFGLFAETVGSAPTLILGNRNYVKRVVFPLEILPLARLLSNLLQAGFAFCMFAAALIILRGAIPWTMLLLPVVILPLALLTLGCALFLASLGVFVRDIQQVVSLVVTMLMFMSAVFYPVSSLPPESQWAFKINPLVPIIEDVRRVCLVGSMPDWPSWLVTLLVSVLVAMAGLFWFMKSKNAFADVV